MKIWMWAIVVVAFLITGALFLSESDPAVMIVSALGYTTVLSAWLGFDIMKMKARTEALPSGKFEDMKITRYLFALISVSGILVVTMVMDTGTLGAVKVTLIPCVFGMMAMIMSAYGTNKAATPKGVVNPPTNGPNG